jgi:hypothetical protein
MKVKLINRYNDIYTFTKTDEGILWEGSFRWCRLGWPNNYDKAYEAYCKDEENPMPLEKFKEKVHSYNRETFEYEELNKKYSSLVYSDTSKIHMVDPSGGPYLTEGTNMRWIDPVFKGLIIDSFKPVETGYLILLK